MLTSYFQDSAVYPNLTLADFPVFAVGARELANATAITFAPILYTDDQLAEWEAFALVADATTMSVLDVIQNPNDMFRYNRTLADGLYAYGPDGNVINDTGSAPYAPIWLISPQFNNTASRMYNQMAEGARRMAIENVLNQGGSVFSRIFYDENDHYPPHIRGDETPRGIVYYPVAGAFMTRTLVGVIGVEFEWASYFDIAFPDQFSGMVIVLESSNGQVCVHHVCICPTRTHTHTLWNSQPTCVCVQECVCVCVCKCVRLCSLLFHIISIKLNLICRSFVRPSGLHV